LKDSFWGGGKRGKKPQIGSKTPTGKKGNLGKPSTSMRSGTKKDRPRQENERKKVYKGKPHGSKKNGGLKNPATGSIPTKISLVRGGGGAEKNLKTS